MNEILYAAAGFVAGIAAGMGMGGGTLLIPVLTLICAVPQHAAQGVNVAAFVPAAIAALFVHKKEGRLDVRAGIPIIIAGIVGAAAAAVLSKQIEEDWLRRVFACFIIVAAVIREIGAERKQVCKKKV